jgi:drug/metabolite transporter (DMT)-like permease
MADLPLKRPIGLAVLAAALFGAATPASKLLLAALTPFQLAGLLYLGAAIGIVPLAARGGGIRLPARADWRNRLRLLGAIVAGGVCGPVLLLLGLRAAAAASVSLWLSFEVAATALLGVLLFRDHLGLPGWVGVAGALAGAILLSWRGGAGGFAAGGFVLLACVCWALDNHLTALVDAITPSQTTFWKGLVAGAVNLAIGRALHPLPAGALPILGGLLVGAVAYGAGIALYISSAQALGATRAQVAFASAPFFGVVFSVLALGERFGLVQLGAAALFLAGVGLILFERHAHAHQHQAVIHEHEHRHDDGHHDHLHRDLPAETRHTHAHRHEGMAHAHAHRPDLHHRHGHG